MFPENAGGWLWTTARQRAIDLIRRRDRQSVKYRNLGNSSPSEPDMDTLIEQRDIGDELLGLVFMTCHPVLSVEARVALTLRSVGGLTTAEIARAFLVPKPRSPNASCGPNGHSPTQRSTTDIPEPSSERTG